MLSGIITLPLSSGIFKNFHDKGWMFSKILGIAFSAVSIWLLSYLKILKFSTLNCYFILAILLIINIFIFIKNKKTINLTSHIFSNILITELLFVILFIFWTFIKSFNVPLDQYTEQFMNYGFMNALMNTSYMPAEDIWFSGNNINYYYFGQYFSAFIAKISFVKVNAAYTLMLALISSFTFILPYSIVYNLGVSIVKDNVKNFSKFIPFITAIIAGLSICIGGTLYYPIYKWFAPNHDSYFYADPTRYIGYRPETNDKTITDIPSYSNVTRDLHAHYVDIIFVFTTLAILLAILFEKELDSTKKRLLHVPIFILGVILGIQKMTNFWDFPIYLVVISAILILNTLIKYKLSFKNILIGFLQILEIVAIEELITLPFTLDLYISATKVYLTHVTSPFYKLLVLWGFPIICYIFNLIIIIFKLIKNNNSKFMDKIKEIKTSDLYILILGICAIGLVILPEIIYLKDIYGDEYKRANTMFKLTYQAYILFSISTSYIIIKHISNNKNIAKKIFAGILLIIYLTTFGYGLNAIESITGAKKTYNLDNSEYYIKTNHPDDYEAIQWIKSNIDREKIILENADGSYNPSGRLSVFTGNPTVLGWHGHQWIWRADRDYSPTEELNNRWNDVYTIYTTNDESLLKDLIKKYNISYIYIGNVELKSNKYLNLNLLLNIGNIVYKKDTKYSITPVYIIDVENI